MAEFVDKLCLFGTEAKIRPTVLGEGEPTAETEGCVGAFYFDTKDEKLYICVRNNNNLKTWFNINLISNRAYLMIDPNSLDYVLNNSQWWIIDPLDNRWTTSTTTPIEIPIGIYKGEGGNLMDLAYQVKRIDGSYSEKKSMLDLDSFSGGSVQLNPGETFIVCNW